MMLQCADPTTCETQPRNKHTGQTGRKKRCSLESNFFFGVMTLCLKFRNPWAVVGAGVLFGLYTIVWGVGG